MDRQTYCSIDPGVDTGVCIFDATGALLYAGLLKWAGSHEAYKRSLEEVRNRWDVGVALVEAFYPMSRKFNNAHKVEVQINACKEAFPCHVLIHTAQWNPRAMSERMKKTLADTVFTGQFRSGHTVDAALQGKFLFDLLKDAVPFPFDYLLELGRTTRRFPLRREIQVLRCRRYSQQAAI